MLMMSHENSLLGLPLAKAAPVCFGTCEILADV